ncbi:ABC transporter ATP-binding protein [Candidatus Nomurabacteria bacterium]|nr:ABC transporter ATP-binding protein [Candidatus Nomurabacteria bacterium]
MEPIIKIQNIVKSFGRDELKIDVLKGISLTINKGDFVALMGKSGAGKSTLFYQMSLLDRQTSGEVFIFDQPTDVLTEEDRVSFRLQHLGYIFQDYALVPELSAEENVMLPLMMLGYEEPEAQMIARRTLDKFGLEGKYTNRPNQLSGGQQQRVSIARAVAKGPEVLFADEPTANLDGASSDEVIDVLRALNSEGQTILMVTHEQDYAKYCNRVFWMEDGLITKE